MVGFDSHVHDFRNPNILQKVASFPNFNINGIIPITIISWWKNPSTQGVNFAIRILSYGT